MPTFRLRHLSPSTATVDRRTLAAIATLLLLAQVPHVLHLPVWISIAGAGIVCARLVASARPNLRWLDRLLSSIVLTLFAVVAAFAIRAHYGYFIGRDPCVAFLFLLVAAKFAELRHASDATFLLCLSCFLLLTQYFYSQSIIAAIVTLPAVFALGNALAVVRDPARATAARTRLTLVARLLVQGAPLAALLFIVFPRLPGPLWSLPEDSMATTGLSDTMAPGSIGEMSRSDAVAFRVEFDAAPPQSRELYWRGPVLEDFDGRAWRAGGTRLSAHPIESADASIGYTVMLQPHRMRSLFALDMAASLPRGSDAAGASGQPLASLSLDGQLLAPDPVTQVIRYRQTSTLSSRLVTDREPARRTLALAGRNPRTERFATELRAQQASDADYVAAVLGRFNVEPFRYTLRPQLLGDAPVDEFLFGTREGFCEHYASAFVVLMRSAGIPSRVVTGYLGGEMNGDYMIVRQSDAHAWAEAWIDGGWQRYDPTGAVAPSRVESGIDTALEAGEPLPHLARLDAGWLRAAQLRWDRLNHGWQRLVVDFDDDSQAELWERLGMDRPVLWQLTAGVMAFAGIWCALLLGVPMPTRFGWRFGRRRKPRVERAWERLERGLHRQGLARQNGEAPSIWLARAASAWPAEATRLARLDEAFATLRFGRAEGDRHERLLGAIQAELRALPGRHRTSRSAGSLH